MWKRIFGHRDWPPELAEALVDVARAIWIVGIGLLLLATIKSQLAQGAAASGASSSSMTSMISSGDR